MGPEILPWPRSAEDGTPLGIDLGSARAPGKLLACVEVDKLTRRVLAQRGAPLDGDDVVQAVVLTILRRNHRECAYDPRRAGFTHYVWQVAGNVIGHLLDERKRERRARPVEQLPELEDEREPLLAYEDTEGLDVRWMREHTPAGQPYEDPPASTAPPVQLALF